MGVAGEETSTRIEVTSVEISIRASKDFLPNNTSNKPLTIPRTSNTPVTIKIHTNKEEVNAEDIHEFKVAGTRETTMAKVTISEAVEDVVKCHIEITSKCELIRVSFSNKKLFES